MNVGRKGRQPAFEIGHDNHRSELPTSGTRHLSLVKHEDLTQIKISKIKPDKDFIYDFISCAGDLLFAALVMIVWKIYKLVNWVTSA